MTGYPLQSALELRRREEAAAAADLANATRELRNAEIEAARWAATVEMAREQLARARHENRADGGRARAAAGAIAEALFVERSRVALTRAENALEEFRGGRLAAARAAETLARQSLLTTRRNREALEKHAEKHQAAARLVAARLAEETLEEVARATGFTAARGRAKPPR